MTVALIAGPTDAEAIAASLDSPAVFGAVFERHHAPVHRYLIPGIEVVGRVRDVAGRVGVGVAFDGEGERSVLVFDPDSYELLGENEGREGSADLESAIVGSPRERP